MKLVAAELEGVHLVELELHEDERGAFARTFCEEEFRTAGLHTHYPQANLSRNTRAGTLRGMHWQAAPHGEVKLVRVQRGAIFDCVVDLRPDSPTFRHWLGVELDDSTARALYVPAGFAHGFQTLVDETEVSYRMGSVYRPEAARGFHHADPSIGIRWPLPVQVLSERDAEIPPAPSRAALEGEGS